MFKDSDDLCKTYPGLVKEIQDELNKLKDLDDRDKVENFLRILSKKYHPDNKAYGKPYNDDYFKVLMEIKEYFDSNKFNVSDFLNFNVDSYLKKEEEARKRANERINRIVANLNYNSASLDVNAIFLKLGEIDNTMNHATFVASDVEEKINDIVNGIKSKYGFDIERYKSSQDQQEDYDKMNKIFNRLQRQFNSFYNEVKNLESRINSFQSVGLDDLRNRYNQSKSLFESKFNKYSNGSMEWQELSNKAYDMLEMMNKHIDDLINLEKVVEERKAFNLRIDNIRNQMDQAKQDFDRDVSFLQIVIELERLYNLSFNSFDDKLKLDLDNLIKVIRDNFGFDPESKKSYREQMKDNNNNSNKENILKQLDNIRDGFNQKCDQFDIDVANGKTVNVEELRKILVDFEKFINDNLNQSLRNDSNWKDVFDRVDESYKIINEVIKDFENKNKKINNSGSNVSVSSLINGFINKLRLHKSDIVNDYPDKEKQFNDILATLTNARDDFDSDKVDEQSLFSLLLAVRNKVVSDFGFDLIDDNNRSYSEQKQDNLNKKNTYQQIINDINTYINILENNESFICSDQSRGLSYSEKNDELNDIKDRLNNLSLEAKEQRRSVNEIRGDLDLIVKEIKDNYDIDVKNKNEKKRRRRKVVSVKKLGLGIGGVGLGIFGVYRLILTIVFYAKYGFAFMTVPQMLVTIGVPIAALTLILKAANSNEVGIIKKCINKLKKQKKRIENELDEEEEVIDRSGGRRR